MQYNSYHFSDDAIIKNYRNIDNEIKSGREKRREKRLKVRKLKKEHN